MVEVYLFAFSRERPFSHCVVTCHAHHYAHTATIHGEYSFYIHDNSAKYYFQSGEYGVVLCTEKREPLSREISYYTYYLMPHALVDIAEDGFRVYAVQFSYPGMREKFGVDVAKGIEIFVDKKYDIHRNEFPPLLLKDK